MKKQTLLLPRMLDIHFSLMAEVLRQEGYEVEVLENEGKSVLNAGLSYVHNDMCYPALLVIGQFLDALKSGKYELDKVALVITQTGGGCRASNYIHLLRKALKAAGLEKVKLLSLNFSGLRKEASLKLSLASYLRLLYSVFYGDLLLLLEQEISPYEKTKGEAKKLLSSWKEKLCQKMGKLSFYQLEKNAKDMVEDFAKVPRKSIEKVKVGIVGEIYMKYSPLGNRHLKDYLESEGAEVVNSGVLGFLLFSIYNRIVEKKLYGKGGISYYVSRSLLSFLEKKQKLVIAVLERGKFRAPLPFAKLRELSKGYLSHGVAMGEGWLLTAEMIEFIHSGVENIICAQPFGCLPNHIVARGMIRKIKDRYQEANIVSIDYDPGASSINQENRIQLMLANGRLQLKSSRKKGF